MTGTYWVDYKIDGKQTGRFVRAGSREEAHQIVKKEYGERVTDIK